MPADKHFHPPAPVPDVLEDHDPDDMPAARSLIAIIGGILVLGAFVAAVLYYTVYKHRGEVDPPVQEQSAP